MGFTFSEYTSLGDEIPMKRIVSPFPNVWFYHALILSNDVDSKVVTKKCVIVSKNYPKIQ